MQRADLSEHHTSSHEDNEANNEAYASLGDLGYSLAIRKDEDGDSEEELDRLEDVDEVTSVSTEYAVESIGVVVHGVAITVQSQEDFI